MSTRERILTIQILEKMKSCPEYAQRLGIELVENRKQWSRSGDDWESRAAM